MTPPTARFAPARLLGTIRATFLTPAAPRFIVVWFVALVALGLAARWWLVKDRPLAGFLDNEDATAHVLATSMAFAQTPASVHYYLPIFTLGRPADKWIDDLPGASAADQYGNYYTSFPPLGFIVPHAAAWAFSGKPLTPNSLHQFNLALHCLLLAASVYLFHLALGDLTRDRASRAMGAIAAGVVLTASREMLVSFSISYWAHQLYHLIFTLQLICLCARRVGVGFAALCVLGCLTEWTAYLVNVGIFGLGLLKYRAAGDRRDLRSAWVALGATLAGGLLLIFWFTRILSPADYFTSLTRRFDARQGESEQHLFALGMGYVRSAGPFLLLGVLAAIRAARYLAETENYDRRVRGLLGECPRITTVAGLVGWSLSENILLMWHATVYSFDRIKFISLLALVAAVLVTRSGSRTLLCGILFVGTLTTLHFALTAKPRSPVQQTWYHLDEYYGGVVRAADPTGTELIFTNQYVRGSKLYYSGHNAIEIRRPNHPKETWDDVRDEVLTRSRAAGAPTAVVFLLPELSPTSAERMPVQFPGVPKVYRVDVATGTAAEFTLPIR